MERYKIMLRKGSKKDFCPDCKRLSFKPYVWADTGEVINPNLGHCDHENSCGHSDKPQVVWDYIKGENIDVLQHKEIEIKQLPTYTFPTDVLERLSKNPLTDKLTTGIRTKFGKRADEVFKEYSIVNIGAEKFHRTETTKGKSDMEANEQYRERGFDGFTGFVYLDKSDKCRGVKVMQYNKDLHRAKYKNGNGIVDWLHKWNDSTDKTMINEDTNEFHECYFGENLLKHGKYKAVGIVESEKTALIGRICCPDILFVAVGGIGKVKYDKLADLELQREKVIFYPDATKEAENEPKNKPKSWGQFVADWQKLAPNWQISKMATENLKNGQDIADILLENPEFADQLNAEAESFSVVEVTATEQPTQGEPSSNNGKPKKKDSFLLAMDWLNERYDIQFDTLRQIPQFKPKDSDKWEDLTDDKASAFYSTLIKADCKISKNQIFDLFANDEVPRIHPIKVYFEGLQPYTENETDYITQLFSNIEDIKDSKTKLMLCKKFFVSIVKTLFDEDFNPQTMLVFRGAPNSGKTTFARNLCPKPLRGKYFCETPPQNPKDLLIALAENLFVFFDELEQYCKADISTMKGLITKGQIKERKSYGHFALAQKRIATMMGACNDAQFLRDITGDRKYLVLEASRINFDYNKIDITDCYRQALYLMKSDFVCTPSPDEVQNIIAENEQYRIHESEEDLIWRYFDIPTEAETKHPNKSKSIQALTAVDILDFLVWGQTGIRIGQRQTSKLLANKGFPSKRTAKNIVYFVKCKPEYWERFKQFLKEKRLNGFAPDEYSTTNEVPTAFDADDIAVTNQYRS